MEQHLLNAALKDRASLYMILDYITTKQYSREFQIIIDKIKEYYDKDETAQHVVTELFVAGLAETIQNKKHLDNFVQIINEAAEADTSTANVQDVILTAKTNEAAMALSVALVNGDKNVTELMEKYRELSHYTTLDELQQAGVSILTLDDLDQVTASRLARKGELIVYPISLNERLDGGACGGHHIVTFARPEMGKTAFNITIACGFARQKAHGIYFINEDRVEDIYMRILFNLSGMNKYDFAVNPEEVKRRAIENGLGYIRLIELAPGTLAQVEAFVDKFRPAWMVMDQLRNLNVKEANKVLQLEYATSGMRNIGKKYNVLTISTTQAGDSAEGKSVLGMGDVDFSNTGVAAQADVLIGIGASPTDEAEGRRILTICKNKISGRHENFPVKIRNDISRYLSYKEEV